MLENVDGMFGGGVESGNLEGDLGVRGFGRGDALVYGGRDGFI